LEYILISTRKISEVSGEIISKEVALSKIPRISRNAILEFLEFFNLTIQVTKINSKFLKIRHS